MNKKPSPTTYKLQLSYRGTNYQGWQNQTTTSETIQNYVEQVIAKISKYQNFQVIGASRTDSGVHAHGQVLKVVLPRTISPEKLLKGMNSKLPQDIRVINCEFINNTFNVNRDVTSKEYHYYFTINKKENALLSETIYSLPKNLDLYLMKKASEALIGKHNFKSFCSPGSRKNFSPIRDISKFSIEKTNFLNLESEVYYLKIESNGFLKYMVRYLMGAIWDIGSKELSIENLSESLISGEKFGIRTKAPAKGLSLIKINYS